MPITTNPEGEQFYYPSEPWSVIPSEAESIRRECKDLLDIYQTSTPDFGLELKIAQQLADYSKDYIPKQDPNCGFFRAANAQDKQTGNCMAHTEATLAIGEVLGLTMGLDWVDNHATSLWVGKAAIWDIDGFYSKAVEFIGQSPQSQLAFLAIRQLLPQNRGLYLGVSSIPNDYGLQHLINLAPAPSQLGSSPAPAWQDINRLHTILPPQQGLSYLGAMGDLVRYHDSPAPVTEAVLEQVTQYVPRNHQYPLA